MDRVFSVDEMADQFWSAHQPPVRLHEDADVEQPSSFAAAESSSKVMRMNRSPSEWAFQRFLQEAGAPDRNNLQSDDVSETKGSHHHYNDHEKRETKAAGGLPPNIPTDSEEYQAFLKSRLELACAAVALTWATDGKAHESAAAATSDIGSQASNSSQYKVA
ncbi:UNVERIFIED_CONTAM: Light-inducible protein CP [Sesamum calycinum]|uniref:Light-inducible protein CP n=1 Tax=Sesamum calycinum TaxID=2727403 RepID=A0AAW2R6V9_9LAMI